LNSAQAPLPQTDTLGRFVSLSVFAHVFLVLIFTIRAFFFNSEPIDYQSAVKVDLVGLPDKIQPLPAPSTPTAPEIQAPPAPKAEKPTPAKAKETPKKKTVVDEQAINLDKKKEKSAMSHLKEMSAFEKIQKELEQDNMKKAEAARAKLIRGNVISTGSQLTGLTKIEAENYIGTVEAQIRQNWSLPQWLASKNLSAQVRVRFDEKGELVSNQIEKSSGNPTFDEIVLDTVRKSSPLPSPPDKFSRLMSTEGILVGFPE